MAYWVFKALLTPVFRLLWRVRVQGRQHVPSRGPAVLAANHQSFCDSFFLPLVLRRRVTFLAKAEYFESWRTAWFFRAAGQIPIRRGGGSVSERALETAGGVLGQGALLALYPEGTRSPDECVHRGRTGVARLALRTGAPVIPVGIVGTTEVQPKGRRLMRPFRTVTVRFGPPLTVEDAAAATTGASAGEESAEHAEASRAFTDRLMRQIALLSERQYVDEYIAVHEEGEEEVCAEPPGILGPTLPGARSKPLRPTGGGAGRVA